MRRNRVKNPESGKTRCGTGELDQAEVDETRQYLLVANLSGRVRAEVEWDSKI